MIARRTGRLALAATTALVAVATPAAGAPGHRDTGRPPRALVDAFAAVGAGDAAAVGRIDLATLRDLYDAAAAHVPMVALFVGQGRDALAGQLGGDLLTIDGWRALGLDPTQPVALALHTGTARALGGAGETRPLLRGGTAPRRDRRAANPAWHARARIAIADPRRAAAFVDRLARLLGAPPATAARRELVRTPDVVVIARVDGGALLVDAFASTASLADLGPYLLDRGERASASALLASTAGQLLAAPGVAVWLDPRRVVEGVLTADPRPARARVDDACELTCSAVTGALGPLGVRLDADHGAIRASARWEVAPGPLAQALGRTVDRGLPRPDDVPGDALVLRSYVASWAPLAGLDTHAVPFDLPPPILAVDDDAWLITALWAWPLQIGGAIAHLSAADREIGQALAGLGDAVVAVLAVGDDLDHTVAIAETTIAPGDESRLRDAATAVWGPPAPADRWGQGRVRAFTRQLAAPRDAGPAPTPTAGLALRDAAVPWLAVTRRAPPPPPGTVAELRVAAAVVARVLPYGIAASQLDASVRFDGALILDARLAPP